MQPWSRCKAFFCPFKSPPEWSDQKKFWTAKSKTAMSWAQQREQIRLSDSAPSRAGRTIPAHAAERRLDARRAGLLPARGPAASEPSVRLTAAVSSRGRLRLHPALQRVKKLVRTLAPDGNCHLMKLGKASFFKEKYTEWLAHVPVWIRGRRKNGRGYERLDYLPKAERRPVGCRRSRWPATSGKRCCRSWATPRTTRSWSSPRRSTTSTARGSGR